MRALIWTLALMLLSGCVTMTDEATVAETNAAYVFGNFSLEKGFMNGQKVALELKSMETGENFTIELRKDKTVYPIKVPPGEYSFFRIAVTDVFSIVVDQIFLDGDFSIKEGQALYLGDYAVTLKRTFNGYKLSYLRKLNSAHATVDWIKQIDPSFEELEYMIFTPQGVDEVSTGTSN